jgi:hypothetical protein
MNCKHGFLSAGSRAISLCAALVASGVLLLPGNGVAQLVTLSDGGSSATLDLGSSAGMNNWSVSGNNQLNQQWFWYRTDGGVAAPINTIGGLTYTLTGNNQVNAKYQNSTLSVAIQYILTGTGPGSADMTESIMLVNKSASTFTANFYQFSSFDLLQSHNNSVQLFADPVNGGYNQVYQTSGSTAIQEAIASPNAMNAEAATGNATLNELNTTPGLILNNNLAAGPGDVTWAFQWTSSVDPGTEFDILKDKSLSVQSIPEPSSSAFALVALGMSAWGFVRRRQSS